jgi:alpha-D-ribose 1-methylphosphonate 5-triphosphate diphosphatase PhnM
LRQAVRLYGHSLPQLRRQPIPFHLTDRGQIAPGLRADLLLVDGDPATDIRATRNISAICKRALCSIVKHGATAQQVRKSFLVIRA